VNTDNQLIWREFKKHKPIQEEIKLKNPEKFLKSIPVIPSSKNFLKELKMQIKKIEKVKIWQPY